MVGEIDWVERETGRRGGRTMAGFWVVTLEAHVMLRFKRVFAGVNRESYQRASILDTPETAADLAWFRQRFPLALTPAAAARLDRQVAAHAAMTAALERVLAPGYVPVPVALAIPPRPYQSLAVDVLRTGNALLLGDDVGLGKTCVAIAAIADPAARPALVVTLTHLPRQWAQQLALFAPGLRVYVAKAGRPPTRPPDPPPDVYVLNYHKLGGWAADLAGRVATVVFDECQELRTGPGTDKYQAATYVAQQARQRLELSATPIYNYGAEMFHVLNVIAPDALGTPDEFAREWCGTSTLEKKGQVRDPVAFGRYLRARGLFLRRTRSEVGRELPPVSLVPHLIDTDAERLSEERDALILLARTILEAPDTRARGEAFRAGGELDWRLRHATGVAKAPHVAAFVKMLLASEERVLLYGWHHDVYERWVRDLHEFSPLLYTGKESPRKKHEAFQAFVEGPSRVLVMSLRAGAGLDGLQERCRTVVFGELDWSPGVHHQCVGRIARDGQAEPVVAYFLHADEGSDPVVMDVLGIKRAQHRMVDDQVAPDAGLGGAAADHIKRLAADYLARWGRC